MHAAVLFLMLLANDLAGSRAVVWYRSLLADSGYGRLHAERAAFLIRESDGALTLEPWPRGGWRHASYRGSVPKRAIAILHTHPHGEPRPSPQDRAEARRLGLAVVVITTDGVIAAMPDGEELMLDQRGENASPRLRNEP